MTYETENNGLTYLILVMLFIGGIWYVGYVNSQDEELIKSCRYDPQCVNPYSGKRLGE